MAETGKGFRKNGISGGAGSLRILFSKGRTASPGLRWVLVLISLPYLLWELYCARQVGYPAIKWHTHLALYYYLWLFGYLILYYLWRPRERTVFVNSVTAMTAVLATLFLAEGLLLVKGIKQTGMERPGLGYFSPYQPGGDTWYHIWPPGKSHWLRKKEYGYIRYTNSLGFSDGEWSAQKKRLQHRILALGDSYTEGDGAPYDSSYVAQLRNILLAGDSSVDIMNAGVCGSDPFINFVNYRDRLLSYQPDIILQTLSSGDLNTDIMVRGGMERFAPHGQVRYRKAPCWEPLYALSNLSRLVFSAMGYNELLVKADEVGAQKKYLDSITVDMFKQYAALAHRHHCRLLIILQPFRDEVAAGAYQYDLSAIRDSLAATENIEVCDLMPFYIAYSRQHHRPIGDYYWPQDGHHNAAGYRMMAEGIAEMIDTQKLNGND